MAKGQKRGNREAKKPKSKKMAPAKPSGFLPQGKGAAAFTPQPKKKG